MGRMWWYLLNALAVTVVHAAPREYSIDELITKPRPGEEYVNIQTTSKGKVDLKDKAFVTSHRIPQTNQPQEFQTSHQIPSSVQRPSRSLTEEQKASGPEGQWSETRVSYSVVEGTTVEPPLERVVTRTSIKMTKSKKVQKSVVKPALDELVDVKANEGVIEKSKSADEEELNIMRRKFIKNEGIETTPPEFSLPLRFNVPLEDDVKDVGQHKHLLIPNPVLVTTQEPPITTFNYKNIYEKAKKGQNIITIISDSDKDKTRYETVSGSESINTAESKTIALKKDTKQEKKERYKSDEKDPSDFYVLPVNKQTLKRKEDSFDFIDVDEKVLIPAGSSPSQSSRINIKKGPNGQDYEYEYVYYYYDEDEDEGTSNGGTALKEGKVVSSTTEKLYNGHDGPTKEEQEQNSVQSTSTSGNKYLPTEAPKYQAKNNKKSRTEEVQTTKGEAPAQNGGGKNSRGGNGTRFSSGSNKQQEVNEVIPTSGRSGFRPRGRSSATTTEEIPSIGEERLPSNTRFPPRARANNGPVTSSPQPQEATTKTRNREGGSQSRLRIPNSSLLDSSSFRTHASDASVEDDSGYDAELQRKAGVRSQTSDSSSRRGTRPTAVAPSDSDEVTEVSRRPSIRKQTEDKRVKVPVEEEVDEDVPHSKIPTENSHRASSSSFDQEQGPGASAEGPVHQSQTPVREEIANGQLAYGGQQVVNGQQTYTGQQIYPGQQLISGHQTFTGQQVNAGPQTFTGQVIGGQQSFVGQPQPEIEYQRRPVGEHATAQGGSLTQTFTQTSEYQGVEEQNQDSKYRTVDTTTEDQAAVGLTSAMMEKVALDLYAILQQAQNENIRTNFVDGNSTDITTDSVNEDSTEYTTYDDELSNPITTTTTTTTTTPAPTTTTTTTTTPAPAQPVGRGRYRGRAPIGKSRSKTPSTTTTEAPEEVTSPKTRGRFHGNHGGRGTAPSFARKPGKPAAKEPSQDVPVNEETPKASPDRSFGERPRNRFRSSGKVTSSPSTTVAPPASNAPASRGPSNDRFHAKRRGGTRGSLLNVQQTTAEESPEEGKHDGSQDNAGSTDAATPGSVSPSKPTRPKIGARPLRPGPRGSLLLPQRGATASTTTAFPEEHEEIEKEVSEPEGQALQQNDENQEVPTPQPGDALTRLKSRPRLRIVPNTNQRPQTSPSPPANRRKLVSSLLAKKKPEEKPAEKAEGEGEEKVEEDVPVEEQPVVQEEAITTTTEAEAKGLNGLLAGKRRNLNRRPGTLYSRAQAS